MALGHGPGVRKRAKAFFIYQGTPTRAPHESTPSQGPSGELPPEVAAAQVIVPTSGVREAQSSELPILHPPPGVETSATESTSPSSRMG